MKSFIKVNLMGLVMFIMSILSLVMIHGTAGTVLGGVFLLVCILYSIFANRSLLLQKQDKFRLEASNKKGVFDSQVRILKRQYDSVMSRQSYFRDRVAPDSNLQEVYAAIIEQIQSNIDSAAQFMESYDYYTMPEPTYLNNLCRDGETLIRKFNALVEQIVDIETNPTTLDMTYVDDVTECLQKMRSN